MKVGLCVLVVLVSLFVCLSVRPLDYLRSNEWICMKLLPEVWLGPRNNRVDLRGDPNYVCLGSL